MAFLRIFLSLAALAAVPAAAETPVTPEEFEAMSTGRTFYYDAAGKSFGAEQYKPGRKVVWAFTGDDCKDGEWYADGPYVCFTYEDEPEPQCWAFARSEQGLIARLRDDPAGMPLVAVEQSPEPMACMGPNVGV